MALPWEPGFLTVTPSDYTQAQAPPTRSLGRAAIDTALDVGQVLPDLYRTTTGIGRSLQDEPGGFWEKRDLEAKQVGKWYEGLKSDRAKELAKESFFPGVDENSAWKDIGAVGMHQVAGVA